jgi:inward rectifier potassium channel
VTDRPRAPFFRPDGGVAIERRGMPRSFREWLRTDVYHWLRTTTWTRLFGAFAVLYLVTNFAFAAILWFGDATIINARPDSFGDRFFFSVQTLATIGYGYLAPGDALANLVVTVESFVGILITALFTGLVFAKFGTITARVLWARTAVVSYESGAPLLQFRMANYRRSAIVEATLKVSLSWTEHLASGEEVRRIYDLALRRATSPMFALSWTAFHAIDAASPLHGATPALLEERGATLLITFTGIDDALATTVHTRHSYPWQRIEWHRRYADILHHDLVAGTRYLDYRGFHDTEPDDAPRVI